MNKIIILKSNPWIVPPFLQKTALFLLPPIIPNNNSTNYKTPVSKPDVLIIVSKNNFSEDNEDTLEGGSVKVKNVSFIGNPKHPFYAALIDRPDVVIKKYPQDVKTQLRQTNLTNMIENVTLFGDKMKMFKFLEAKYPVLDFLPQTYVDVNNKNFPDITDYWILKPSKGSHGEGIKIISSKAVGVAHINLTPNKSWILSKFIESALYNKKKFHFRYFTLLSKNKSKTLAYTFKFPVAYLANENYKNPLIKLENITNLNYGNRNPVNRIKKLEEMMTNYNQIEADSITIINKTMNQVSKTLDCYNPNGNCFQLLAYDFLVDKKGKTWLLEINTNPGLKGITYLYGEKIVKQIYTYILNKTLNSNWQEPTTFIQNKVFIYNTNQATSIANQIVPTYKPLVIPSDKPLVIPTDNIYSDPKARTIYIPRDKLKPDKFPYMLRTNYIDALQELNFRELTPEELKNKDTTIGVAFSSKKLLQNQKAITTIRVLPADINDITEKNIFSVKFPEQKFMPKNHDIVFWSTVDQAHEICQKLKQLKIKFPNDEWLLKDPISLSGKGIFYVNSKMTEEEISKIIDNYRAEPYVKGRVVNWGLNQFIVSKKLKIKPDFTGTNLYFPPDKVGRAFHLRIFVMVQVTNKKVIGFRYKNYLIYTCPVESTGDVAKDILDKNRFITHTGSKLYPKWLEEAGETNPHLITLVSERNKFQTNDVLFPQLKNPAKVEAQIDEICANITKMVQKDVECKNDPVYGNNSFNSCFTIFGGDFVIDDQENVYILEVNENPNLSYQFTNNDKLKYLRGKEVIRDAFKVLFKFEDENRFKKIYTGEKKESQLNYYIQEYKPYDKEAYGFKNERYAPELYALMKRDALTRRHYPNTTDNIDILYKKGSVTGKLGKWADLPGMNNPLDTTEFSNKLWDEYKLVPRNDIRNLLAKSDSINHIVNIYKVMDDKKALYRALIECQNSQKPECKKISSFLPKTWTKDFDNIPFDGVQKYIFKPTNTIQGHGIKIIRTKEEMDKVVQGYEKSFHSNPRNALITPGYVISYYIGNPLKLKIFPTDTIGRKTHLRVYILLTRNANDDKTLKMYLYNKYNIYTAPVEYDPKKEIDTYGNINPFIALSNLEVSKEYEKKKGNNVTVKQVAHKYTRLYEFEKNYKVDKAKTTEQIKEITTAVVESTKDYLSCINSNNDQSKGCYHLIALDLMHDDQGKLWFLEVNYNPGRSGLFSHLNAEQQVSFYDDIFRRTIDEVYPKNQLYTKNSPSIRSNNFELIGTVEVVSEEEVLTTDIPKTFIIDYHNWEFKKKQMSAKNYVLRTFSSLRQALEKRNWKELTRKEAGNDNRIGLVWSASKQLNYQGLYTYRLNFLKDKMLIDNKLLFYKELSKFGSEFIPKYFEVPFSTNEEMAKFVFKVLKDYKNIEWLLKDSNGSDGRGIFYINKNLSVEEILRLMNIYKIGKPQQWLLNQFVNVKLVKRNIPFLPRDKVGRRTNVRVYISIVKRDNVFEGYMYNRFFVFACPKESTGNINADLKDPLTYNINLQINYYKAILLQSKFQDSIDKFEEWHNTNNYFTKDEVDQYIKDVPKDEFKKLVNSVLNSFKDAVKTRHKVGFNLYALDVLVSEDNKLYILETNPGPYMYVNKYIQKEYQGVYIFDKLLQKVLQESNNSTPEEAQFIRLQ